MNKPIFNAFAFSDKVQEHAFRNLMRFAAVVLAFAIVSRGTQSAFMPSVTLCNASSSQLEEVIEAKGFINMAQGVPFSLPSGILIKSVAAQTGKEIKAGEALAEVFKEDADIALKAAKAQLGLLQAQYSQQSKGEITDDYFLKQAQARLDDAYNEYNKAQTEDERTAALQAAQIAESARNDALHTYRQSALQTDKANIIGKANAMVTLAQIDEIKSQLEDINKIISQDYKICAESDGIITELRLTAGEISGEIGGFIADKASLSALSFTLDSEQAQNIKPGSEVTVIQENLKTTAIINTISAPDADGKITAAANLQGTGFKVGTAQVKIYLSKNSYDLCLPQQAVYADINGSFVFVLEQNVGILGVQNIARRVYVTVQKQTTAVAAVSGALDNKSNVILTSSRILQDGAKVKVKQ